MSSGSTMIEPSPTSKLRNARACEACRASKSKCTFKPQQAICQRCEINRGRCIVRTKARPMRTRQVHSSANPDKSQAPIFNDEFALSLPSIAAPDAKGGVEELHAHHVEFLGDPNTAIVPVKTESTRKRLEPRKVTLGDAERLLSAYQKKASFFPFVNVPSDATVPHLSKKSPFLLLAILNSAAINDPHLYHQMEHEFKRVLSGKIIVEGKKSLDFLQGLLVYIAWYPVHTNPKNNQSFMYMNLAISLVTDLGLDRETPNPSAFSDFDLTGLYTKEGGYSIAAKQAYLGTYYLSSALSLGFQKPNNFQYRNLMDDHGRALLRSSPSCDFFALVQLQHLRERIAKIHLSKTPAADYKMEAINAEMNIQIFLNELQDWSESVSEDIRNLPNIKLSNLFVLVCIYSYELGFLRKPYKTHLLPHSPYKSLITTSHLPKCLDSLKRFFEFLLSIPEEGYLAFTTVEWGQVINAIVVISRLTFLMADEMGWDASRTRTEVPLVMYLDCLSFRFGSLSRTKDEDDQKIPDNPDVLYVFKLMIGSVKKSYERRVSGIRPGSFTVSPSGNATGPTKGQCPILDPSLKLAFSALNTDNTYISFDQSNLTSYPAPDSELMGFAGDNMMENSYGGWEGSGSGSGSGSGNGLGYEGMGMGGQIGVYHNVWATMTCSWAEDFYEGV